MRVIDKSKQINISIDGKGVEQLLELIRNHFPEAYIQKEAHDDEEMLEWNATELAQEIKANKTPGKLLRAYRLREGMTLVELAEKVGTKYPNLSAMENDRREIGLKMAKNLGEVLKLDFKKFLA